MARVVLLTGGNSGDVKRTLQAAQQLVNAKVGAVLRCSHRYETKPWGFDADGVFSNQALESRPTCCLWKCSTPCRPSNGSWAATAPPKLSRKPARA